jgi:hypothetical protein
MSCNLTTGRIVPCRNKSGGIKKVFFANFGDLGAITEAAGLITAFAAASPDMYEYDVRGASNLDTTVTSSTENGTTFYTQSLTLQLQYYDRATSEEIKLLAVGRPHIVVQDNDDNYLMVGQVNGCTLNTGNFTVGAAMGDFNGFNLTFEAIEKAPPSFVTPALVTTAATGNSQISTFPTS